MKKLLMFLAIGFVMQSMVFAAIGWNPQTGPTTNILRDVYVSNEAIAVAVGDSGIDRTTNYGQTWTRVLTSAGINFTAVSFPTTMVGYAIGNNGANGVVYKTINGGQDWTDLTVADLDSQTLYDVFFVSTTVGYMCYNSSIKKTTDSGATWNDTTGQPAGGGLLYGIFMLDANTGYICGQSGKIFWTINGGDSWLPQISTTGNDLNDIFFVDSNNGWAVGTGGMTTFTTDGGTNWKAEGPIFAEDLNGVHFIDANNGLAVGAGGKIAKTTGGGDVGTWNEETSGTTKDLNGIYYYDGGNAFAVGGDGIAASTIDHYYTATAPTISSIALGSYASGYPGETSAYTISGTNFNVAGGSLSFASGDINVTSASFASSTSITGTLTVTNSATAGNYTFTVNNGDGNSVASTLTVDPNMTISGSGLTPSTVDLGATVSMTISGNNFGSGITVSDIVFSKGEATSITTLNSNSIVIIFTAPSAGTGTGDLTITNDNGEVKTVAGCLTITDPTVTPPSITSLSKSSGTQGETLSLDINGANFVTNPTVSFSGSGISVNSTTYNSSSSLTISIAIAADATAGLRTLIVDNNNGGLASYGNAFSVISSGGGTAPTINSGKPIIPSFGIKQTSSSPSSSGLSTFAITGDDEQSYAINGSNFGADMQVVFSSSSPATTSIMAPPAVPIPSQITVRTNPDGTQQIIFYLNELTVPLGFYDFRVVDSSTGLSASKTRAFEVKDSTVVAANIPAAQAYPSPADPETAGSIRLQFEMAEAVDNVYIWIYDIAGAEVQKIGPINTHTGSNTTEWNFIRIDGLKVGDGIYVFKVGTGNRTFTSGKFAVHRPKRN